MAELLAVPDGYDPDAQAVVGLIAAGLDDQSRRLQWTVNGLDVTHLEWQERPGRNTIGMLMWHLAATEIAWLRVACAGLSIEDTPESRRASQRVLREYLGHDAGGDLVGTHAEPLKGCDLESYLDLLARARRSTHELLKTWDDVAIRTVVSLYGGGDVSRRWVLYHLLEHVAAHNGQIASLLHIMRDHDLPGLPKPALPG